ncbi:hypothetical protein BD779DRAFT_1666666 [Infundibulicybe gibba]|nr:hypothetical protein BD779DRAFT_1666666 [Infundibulicybe gibba]
MNSTTQDQKRLASKFYQQDIVQVIEPPQRYGIVLRCWHDAEDMHPPITTDPLMRPLNPGEVGVTFLAAGGERMILLESQLRLIDRSFRPGDFCKRGVENLHSGVITRTQVTGRLAHAVSGEPIEGWKTLNDIRAKGEAETGDYVVYNDWLGQIIELFDESILEVSNGRLVRLPELSNRLAVGERGTELLPPSNGVGEFARLLWSGAIPESMTTVIAVKHTVYAIVWLALTPLDATKKKRPQRFWYGADIEKLTLIRGQSDSDLRVGDRVYLKDCDGLPSTRHGVDDPNGIISVHAFRVAETRTIVDVLWQDGSRQSIPSVDLIPYLNPDEYDCWPGDHVLWKNEDMERPAIVQSVDAAQRIATVLFPDTKETEFVSLLELNVHGMMMIPQSGPEGLGVRRGDFVFIHPSGSTNGFEKPHVPRIGELEGWALSLPSDGERGWRMDMTDIGINLAKNTADNDVARELQLPSHQDESLSWIGEVADLKLDGTVEVTHPNSSIKIYPLERLTRLYDGIEQIEDSMWDDDATDSQGSDVDIDNREFEAMDEDGVWRQGSDTADDEWEEMDEGAEDGSMDADNREWADEFMIVAEGSHKTATPIDVQRSASRDDELIASKPGHGPTLPEYTDDPIGPPWKQFDILPSTPLDHAFLNSPPAQPSKTFLGRLSREYRALASSLPASIFVRAFEDRTDLLRCLIIGTENTPYEDAPFVIDWSLDSNFPNSPPIAHFLSWTNGNGRVNPNLYEEGKVCLSILGTWAGDKSECWSAARSSLLQAFVSIQGLVLVKEPWFCEPAFEKLRGTEEGIVNSQLYSEKAYVLSRGFVRRALEIPVGGFESELKWIYLHDKRLEKVIRDANDLILKSRSTPEISDNDKDLAVPRLTAGGIIALERTLNKLQVIRWS